MLHVHKTGRLARPLDDYPPAVAAALLLHSTTALLDEMDRLQREQAWLHQSSAPPKIGGQASNTPRGMRPPTGQRPRDWATPRITGDPVADEWERAIARGETPDLTRGPRG